jgi:segregation and condensation protein B
MSADLKNRIEAILFASGKGVSEEDLAKFCDSTPAPIKKQVKKLQEEYLSRDSSLVISHINNKWKLTVRGKYLSDIERLTSETELNSSVLKTLAIIAFKSPLLQSTLIDMRGQGAYDHVKILVKEQFVTKEDEGRSFLLKITDKFYDYFDIQGDAEIREVFDLMRKQQQKIVETALIQAEKEQKKLVNEEDLGNLEIVDSAPQIKTQTPEEKQEEQNFLENIDKRISETAQRLNQQQILNIKRFENEEEKLEQTKNENEISNEDISEKKQEEKTDMNAQASQEIKPEEEPDYKKELEDFVKKEEEKKEKEEKFL